MNTNQGGDEDSRPLQLHIRRLRQWYGEHGLPQKDLAELAGLSVRQLYEYETCRDVPRPIEILTSLALALEVPIENLFSPDYLDERRADVEARRLELGLAPDDQEDATGGSHAL